MSNEPTSAPEADSPPAATPPADAPAARSGIDTKAIEGTLIEAGDNVEAAARKMGQKLAKELLDNETGREVKQKVSSFWGRIKEKIQ